MCVRLIPVLVRVVVRCCRCRCSLRVIRSRLFLGWEEKLASFPRSEDTWSPGLNRELEAPPTDILLPSPSVSYVTDTSPPSVPSAILPLSFSRGIERRFSKYMKYLDAFILPAVRTPRTLQPSPWWTLIRYPPTPPHTRNLATVPVRRHKAACWSLISAAV